MSAPSIRRSALAMIDCENRRISCFSHGEGEQPPLGAANDRVFGLVLEDVEKN